MSIEIRDSEGRGTALEVAPGPPEGPLQVGIRIEGVSSWSCSPAAARELAAALVAAATEAEHAGTGSPSPSRRASCDAVTYGRGTG